MTPSRMHPFQKRLQCLFLTCRYIYIYDGYYDYYYYTNNYYYAYQLYDRIVLVVGMN